MTTIKFFRPFDLGNLNADGAPTVTATRFTLPLVDEDILNLLGRFDTSSEAAIESSPFTKLNVLDDATARTPLVTASGFVARLTDLENVPLAVVITRGNDKITGSVGDDNLLFLDGEGNDRVAGGGGNDQLGGSEGRDILLGGAGDDLLVALSDPDILTGGRGADDFFLASPGSVITDFRRADGDQVLVGENLFVIDVDLSTNEDPGEFIDLRAVSGGVELRFDPNGGRDNFETLAIIRGDFGTDLDQLLNSGALLSGEL